MQRKAEQRASANLESDHEELQELLARLTEENQSRQLLPTQWERKWWDWPCIVLNAICHYRPGSKSDS